MKPNRVIFLDTVHPVLWERLSAAGFECLEQLIWTATDLEKNANGIVGLVIRSRIKITKEVLQILPDLKWIARSGAGMENIDLVAAENHGVKCYNSPEGNRDAVGEQAIGMLLSLFNNLKIADEEVRQGIWKREENRGYELSGKTVGIIGFGFMGAAFAKKLRGFDCTILAYDKYKTNYAPEYVTEVPLAEIFNRADIVSLHLPLTEETRHFVNDDFVSSMKNAFYLINTARGQNVDTKALINGLLDHKIKGACLDVLEFEKFNFEKLEKEKLPETFQQLTQLSQVVLSPHVAGWTHESYFKLSNVLADKILSSNDKSTAR